ncbi:hypothetical protein BJ546DRAFT_1001965 [Cryomyces antarcticus]|uniref:BTB domain-containing protein n=1 Tax=Cryomyces antarcticus TaxID=329879 RepID=A0ABR0KTZ7_9PEZI|nr:hypothetical protein LTR39_000898 [Cryomyces antarcticus]KAK5130611.1 hypothetical protein LTR16_001406 [Cryomyces antarcticus]
MSNRGTPLFGRLSPNPTTKRASAVLNNWRASDAANPPTPRSPAVKEKRDSVQEVTQREDSAGGQDWRIGNHSREDFLQDARSASPSKPIPEFTAVEEEENARLVEEVLRVDIQLEQLLWVNTRREEKGQEGASASSTVSNDITGKERNFPSGEYGPEKLQCQQTRTPPPTWRHCSLLPSDRLYQPALSPSGHRLSRHFSNPIRTSRSIAPQVTYYKPSASSPNKVIRSGTRAYGGGKGLNMAPYAAETPRTSAANQTRPTPKKVHAKIVPAVPRSFEKPRTAKPGEDVGIKTPVEAQASKQDLTDTRETINGAHASSLAVEILQDRSISPLNATKLGSAETGSPSIRNTTPVTVDGSASPVHSAELKPTETTHGDPPESAPSAGNASEHIDSSTASTHEPAVPDSREESQLSSHELAAEASPANGNSKLAEPASHVSQEQNSSTSRKLFVQGPRDTLILDSSEHLPRDPQANEIVEEPPTMSDTVATIKVPSPRIESAKRGRRASKKAAKASKQKALTGDENAHPGLVVANGQSPSYNETAPTRRRESGKAAAVAKQLASHRINRGARNGSGASSDASVHEPALQITSDGSTHHSPSNASPTSSRQTPLSPFPSSFPPQGSADQGSSLRQQDQLHSLTHGGHVDPSSPSPTGSLHPVYSPSFPQMGISPPPGLFQNGMPIYPVYGPAQPMPERLGQITYSNREYAITNGLIPVGGSQVPSNMIHQGPSADEGPTGSRSISDASRRSSGIPALSALQQDPAHQPSNQRSYEQDSGQQGYGLGGFEPQIVDQSHHHPQGRVLPAPPPQRLTQHDQNLQGQSSQLAAQQRSDMSVPSQHFPPQHDPSLRDHIPPLQGQQDPSQPTYPQQGYPRPFPIHGRLPYLMHHLGSQFGSAQFADYVLHLEYAENQSTDIPVHGLIISQSPTLQRLMMAAASQGHSPRILTMTLQDGFITYVGVSQVVQHLYGMGPFEFDRAWSGSPAVYGLEVRVCLEHAIAFMGAGLLLEIPSAIEHGYNAIVKLLCWSTLESAFNWAISKGLSHEWLMEDAPADIYHPVKPRTTADALSFPPYNTRMDSSLWMPNLLHEIISFVARNTPTNFVLDRTAPPLKGFPRLPFMTGTKPAYSHPGLRQVKFGDLLLPLPNARTNAGHSQDVLSSMFLSFPFALLKRTFEHNDMRERFSRDDLGRLIHTVVEERSRRRLAVVQNPHAVQDYESWKSVYSDKTLSGSTVPDFDELNWQERVERSGQPGPEWRLWRYWQGVRNTDPATPDANQA